MQYFLRVLITSVLVVSITETAKISKLWGAFIASLPLTSLLAIIWLYYDTNDKQLTAELANGILYLVIPSMAFFVVLPQMLKRDYSFALSLVSASVVTAGLYALTALLINKLS